jgi:hypothetical protein
MAQQGSDPSQQQKWHIQLRNTASGQRSLQQRPGKREDTVAAVPAAAGPATAVLAAGISGEKRDNWSALSAAAETREDPAVTARAVAALV